MRFFGKQSGFTLVELLIVITVIGLLATAVLAAINPAEQIAKGRDTARKADASTLVSALDRYQASFGCYPWYRSGTTCLTSGVSGSPTVSGVVITSASFTGNGILAELQSSDELRDQFSSRPPVNNQELLLSEAASGEVSICFAPESGSAREGGVGPLRVPNNSAAVTGCPANYAALAAGDGSNASLCAVCAP